MGDHNRPTVCATCLGPLPPRKRVGRPRLYCCGQCRGRGYVARMYGIDYAAIGERWGKVCYLCGEHVDTTVPSGPKMANIDHVIPLSRGGASVVENLRLVHYGCNLRKGAMSVCPHCAKPF